MIESTGLERRRSYRVGLEARRAGLHRMSSPYKSMEVAKRVLQLRLRALLISSVQSAVNFQLH